MADKFVRISELPEASQFTSDDYLAVENELDTWKVKMVHFDRYIKDKVDIYEKNIVNNVDLKLNEIQTIITNTEEIINNINIKLGVFNDAEVSRKEAEKEREQNEAIRQRNEEDRQKQSNEASINEDKRKADEDARNAAEKDRKDAEDARDAAERDRISNEAERIRNEQSRQTAETNRQTAENERNTNETNRNTNEGNRQTNETDRINKFNEMKDIIDNFNIFLQNNSREGISKINKSDSGYLPILEIAIPKEFFEQDDESKPKKKYTALVYCSIGQFTKTVSNTEGGYEWPEYKPGGFFFSVEIFLISRKTSYENKLIGMSVTSTERLMFNSLISYDQNYAGAISGGYHMQGDVCIIKLFMPIYTNSNSKINGDTYTASASILWDNILEFKHDSLMYYSKALGNQSVLPTTEYNSTYRIPFKDDIKYFIDALYNTEDESHDYYMNQFYIDNMPRGFIDLIHSIYMQSKYSIYALIRNKYMFYPVGSIYVTTNKLNPGRYLAYYNDSGTPIYYIGDLGGGEWELINNDGITYEWHTNIMGTPQIGNVSGTPDAVRIDQETIYIWKRVK